VGGGGGGGVQPPYQQFLAPIHHTLLDEV